MVLAILTMLSAWKRRDTLINTANLTFIELCLSFIHWGSGVTVETFFHYSSMDPLKDIDCLNGG